MTDADVPRATTVTAEAFGADITAQGTRERWQRRLRHTLLTDPGGSFVAEQDDTVVGVAEAVVRDRTWILSLLVVSPSGRRGGEGRALLDAGLAYGSQRGAEAGLIVASSDPRALRLYATSGFTVQPTFEADGAPGPSLIPPPDPAISIVDPGRVDVLAPISRAVRGAEHTPDFAVAFDRDATIFALAERGFVVAAPGHGVQSLAALDERSATTLLWCALHHLRDEPRIQISFITGAQQWALEVLLAARIPFTPRGALCTRAVAAPLHPYIPSPPFA